MLGIWEIILILGLLAWMIVPFFMKKARYQERQERRQRARKPRKYDSVEELDSTNYEVLEDE